VGKAFLDETLAETQFINHYMKEQVLENCIIRPGAVSIEKLCGIYSGASVYVQPSYYEGFGLPVLEAFVCGCPVVCTNTSSLPEIAGPALQVSPDEKSLLSGIVTMLGINRKVQIKQQHAWVRQFTWEKTAKDTIASYKRALA
jgi:alpha-1,3-rhamnosyl/mannosyltransferase